MLRKLLKPLKINTLNKKLNISIVVFYVIIMLISTIISVKTDSDKKNSKLRNKGKTFITLASHACIDPIWNFNGNGLKTITDSFFNDKEIYSIVVINSVGEKLYSKTNSNKDLKKSGTLKFSEDIVKSEDKLGKIEITITKYYLKKEIKENILKVMIRSLIVALSLSVIIFIISLKITKPLEELIKISSEISNGKYESRSSIKTSDEIGLLSKQFDKMAKNICIVMNQLNKKSEELEDHISNLKKTNKSILTTSSALNNSSTDLAALSEELNAGMQEISSSSGIISQVITNVFKKTKSATVESDTIVYLSSESVKIVKNTIGKINIIKESFNEIQRKVESLNNQSEEIIRFTSLISNISSQTNLIALNATIEAARACESGKGFTIVANEIRKLSIETNSAVVEINNLVSQIKKSIEETVISTKKGNLDVNEGVNFTKETFKSFNVIYETIGKNKKLIKDIEFESKKAVEGAENVASSTGDFLLVIEQLVSSSTDLSKLSEKLLNTSENF